MKDKNLNTNNQIDKSSSSKEIMVVNAHETVSNNKTLDLELLNYVNKLKEIGEVISPTVEMMFSRENIDILCNYLRNNYDKYIKTFSLLNGVFLTSEIEWFYIQTKDAINNIEKIAIYLAEYLSKFDKLWVENKTVSNLITSDFAAQNLAFIRLLPDYEKMPLPRGSKKTLRSLTQDAANELIKTEDYLFDPVDSTFYFKGKPEAKISVDEFTITTTSLEMFEGITLNELLSFETKLFKNANMAFKDKTGQKIFNIINNWSTFINFEDITYYHARKIEGDMPYLDHEMMMAPVNVSSHGRYNDVGRSCYYITETREGAIKEIKAHSGGKKNKIQIVGLKHIKNAKIIDLSGEASKTNTFIEHLRYSVDFEKEKGKIIKEYLLPNYVASCCREVGIDGIKYKSGKTKYNSLVLWEDYYFKIEDDKIEVIEA